MNFSNPANGISNRTEQKKAATYVTIICPPDFNI